MTAFFSTFYDSLDTDPGTRGDQRGSNCIYEPREVGANELPQAYPISDLWFLLAVNLCSYEPAARSKPIASQRNAYEISRRPCCAACSFSPSS